MNLKFTVAAAVIAVTPFCAQAQQRSAPKATDADAQRVVKAIASDKAKLQAYCDMAKLADQMDQAEQRNDDKKMAQLSEQADALTDKIGPEYAALIDGLQDMDEESKEGKAIGATLSTLDRQCPK